MHSQTSNWARNRFQPISLSVILSLYFIPQVLLIDKPGMQQDEAGFLIPSLELAHGKAISYGNSINLFGIHYPTMVGPYTGNSLTLPVALAVRIFGFDQSLVRLLWIIVGAGTILFTFLVCRELFNGCVGLLASLLLAVNPTFWMFNHVGAFASVSLTLDVMGSLFFFLYFFRTKRWIALFLAMLLTGHGLYTKLVFGYFLIAYLVAFGYLWIRGRLHRDVLNVRHLLVSTPAFILGAWPLLYTAATDRSTLAVLRTALMGTAVSGQSNLDVLTNFSIRLEQTRSYLEGRFPIDQIVADIPVAYNRVMPYVFCGSLLFVLLVIFLRRQPVFGKEQITFPIVVVALFQCLTIFTPSTLNSGVFAFIPPFAAIILALAFYLLFDILNSRKNYLGWIAVIGVLFLLYTESSALSYQYDAIRTTGGKGVWSSTTSQLTQYLLQNSDRNPVALDWGLDNPVYVLSNLQTKPSSSYFPFTTEKGSLRLWQNTPPAQFGEQMETLIYQPQNIYLARNDSYAQFKGRLDVLREIVESNGGELVKIHSVFESDGTEFIKVYAVSLPQGRRSISNVGGGPKDTSLRNDFPEITSLHPDRSVAGIKFNEQPNSQSAIAVVGKRFSRSSVIFFNDQPLETTFGSEELLTALVPDKFLNPAGEIKVSVVNLGRFESNTMILTIAPNPSRTIQQ